MVHARTRSLRDAVLILLGATCMHFASNFMELFQDNQRDIIVNTQVNQPIAVEPHFKQPILQQQVEDDEPLFRELPPQHSSPALYDLAYEFPETTIDSHAPGWTVFRNLYMSNGTLFIVSSRPSSAFPETRFMTSTGLPAENTPENIAARMPTADDMAFITPEQARVRWGPLSIEGKNRVWPVEGNTFLFNDPAQFLDHYYHFCAELLFGAWAFWSGAHNAVVDAVASTAPPIQRAVFAHADAHGWRDRPGFNAYFLRAAFPSLTVEVQDDWEDRVMATSAIGKHARAWHFDSVLLSDRSAAFRGELCGSQVQRTAAEAYHYMQKSGNLTKWWWEPVRRAVLKFGGVEESTMDIALRAERNQLETVRTRRDIVVTYISRQGVRRHLSDDDHDKLVATLTDLCARKGWELNVVMAERLTKDEQVALIARTTILLGVHGNGLTHLILMAATPVSTVIEMFYPGGFAHDYEWTTRGMGMKHFAVQNDTYYTHPNLPWVNYPEGFQGQEIPVYAPTIVKIIEDRVAGQLPNTDPLLPIVRRQSSN